MWWSTTSRTTTWASCSDVDGQRRNEGVSHSFQVTKDALPKVTTRLINHKTYYFMALAYGYNNYEEYDPNTGSGQDVQYKASRKAAVGSIRVYSGTPHKPTPESGGLIQAAAYGDGVTMTRLEGQGNGLNDVALTAESEDALVSSGNGKLSEVTYEGGSGPVSVRVVDPLSVPNAQFELRVLGEAGDLDEGEDVEWVLTNTTMLDTAVTSSDSAKAIVTSDRTIDVLNEQLILQWGLGVTVHQTVYPSGTDVATPSDRPSPSPTLRSRGSWACLTAKASPRTTGSVPARRKATTSRPTSLSTTT